MTSTKREIVMYVLKDVLEFQESKAEALIDGATLNTVARLLRITPKTLDSLVGRKVITESDRDSLEALLHWYQQRRSSGLLLPATLEEWRQTLTADNIDDVSTVTMMPAPGSAGKVDKPRTSTISVKLQDYPIFKGTQTGWLDFKQAFTATALLSPVGPLLSVTDLEEHEKKRESDADYDRIVRDLYGILANRTAGGLSAARVTKHGDTLDGVLAWRDLLAYWDLCGNLESYGSQKIAELTALEYRGNAHGGMDAYINKFEGLCLELARANQHVDDPLKKTFFLKGIKDPDFSPIKDLCSKASLQETIMEVRKKAQSMAKPSSSASFNRHQNNKQQKARRHAQQEREKTKNRE